MNKPHFNTKGRFTQYLNKARMRTKTKPSWDRMDLTEEYLQTIWKDQQGCCAWSGLPMQTFDWRGIVDYWNTASLDRIDSSKGYVQGNVQFVLAPLNMAKKEYPDADMKKFLTKLRESG